MKLPTRLEEMPLSQLEDLLCRANPGVWAERKRGFVNAPVHWEWYSLMTTMQRGCVVAPREHAKSECWTVNGTAWRSIYTPGIWTYVFAATADLATELKERIDSAVREAEPELVNNAYALSKTQTVYGNGSRITCAGAGKAVRGAHPDVIVGDDVLSDDSAATEHQRKKILTWWSGTIGGMSHPGTTRVVRGHGRLTFRPTQVFLVGTPFHSQDLLSAMKGNKLYHYRRYSAEYHVSQLVDGTMAVEVANG